MSLIKKTCKLTGRAFEVSELEQELRKKFNAPLPDVHPYERMRELLSWRNIFTLYNHVCDLCKKPTLCYFNPETPFPKYCRGCWYGDGWELPQRDIDFNRPFFEQLKDLVDITPQVAISVSEPMENSDFNNAATSLKNCYMCFNVGYCEDTYYLVTGMHNKNVVDAYGVGNSEIVYDCTGCDRLYNVFYSEQTINCRDSLFLYDCQDCADCFMSSGLRHKRYVWRNEQLSEKEYSKRLYALYALNLGSYEAVQSLREEFKQLKQSYKLPALWGSKNENSSGNFLAACNNVEDSYMMDSVENAVNCYDLLDTIKDCLDVCAFGYGLELCYQSSSAGLNCYNIRHTFLGIEKSTNLEYCYQCRTVSDAFGCVGARKKQYCILNKMYSKEEYAQLHEKLIAHMKETGEYGQFFPQSLNPFGYNETVARLAMPLAKQEALARGFKWFDKPIPVFPPEKVYVPPDHIKDTHWEDINGKVLICEVSKRPFNITKQEFEFYKKYTIPLPRLHPEIRLAARYPREEMYNLHTVNCAQCKNEVKTSMPRESAVLCEECYRKQVY